MQNMLVLSIAGLVERPISSCEVVKPDPESDVLELTFTGPEGPVVLRGDTSAIYQLILGVELAVRDYVVEG